MLQLLGRTLVSCCSLVLAASVFAQTPTAGRDYPARAVKLLSPFPPGSQTDLLARLLASQFQELLGQPFVVDNRTGANGSIAAEALAASPPDGYTIMLSTNSPLATNVSIFKKLSYDPLKDFSHVVRIGVTMWVLMVRPDFPARSLEELIRSARQQPQKFSGGSGGGGGQMSMALLNSMARVEIIEVVYKGVPQAVSDVLGGAVTVAAVDLGNAVNLAESGRLRGLAVTSERRSPLLPDMPAIAETLPGYHVMGWMGLITPAATAPEITAKLHDTTMKVLAKPDNRARIASLGIDIAPLESADFKRFVESEIPKWAALVKLANLQPH